MKVPAATADISKAALEISGYLLGMQLMKLSLDQLES
jgi:hypothetical protein